ncbi:MAG: glucose-6-phosphate dehydrogenase [Armatimonadota bacterium]
MQDTLQVDNRRPGPCTVVIFGASGDLTRRKLLPALWNLYMERRLPEQFSIVGMARTDKSDEEFRREAREAAERHSRFRQVDEAEWETFSAGLFYLQGRYDQPDCYQQLSALLDRLCDERGSCGNNLFYLATPPSGYAEIVQQLGASGLAAEEGKGGWARVIVEKPFGHNLRSARELNQELKQVFGEHQIYRIDHYLGKETVQNLMVFRFANGIFEPIWNRRYVDHVQISVSEELGVEGRGAYYEEAGALRDMVQNHLMQVLCLVAMEPPASMDHRAVRNEKTKVLEAIRPISVEEVPEWTARGQYSAGEIDGKAVPGYKEEPGVAPASRTETYAAVKWSIENWRWAGVPFYLRSGKRLPCRVTEVSIHFRRAPHLLFRGFGDTAPERNVLTIRIQPNEGIGLRFGVKVPGSGMKIRPVHMRFDYQQEFEAEPPDAYERLLLDCMLGDITLFSRDDWMELSWELIDPILTCWEDDECESLPQYPAGSWGPAEADALLARDGRAWRTPDMG